MKRLAVAALLAIAVGSGAARSAEPGAMVALLGQGTPLLDGERSGIGVGVAVRGTLYVFDAGPGIEHRQYQLMERHKELGIKTVGPVFITHLHSDHTLGLPALLYHHGNGPLTVYGPPGIAAMMRHIGEAWQEDRDVRLEEDPTEDRGRWGLDAKVTEIGEGPVFKDGNIAVTAFAVPHAVWKHAFGYRIEAGGRSIVLSGDTHPTDAVVRACHGCDLLFHEVYSQEFFDAQPAHRKRYHSGAHTSAAELARIATEAKPGLLVLYHQLYGSATDADLVREVREAGYTGKVVSAKDLDVF